MVKVFIASDHAGFDAKEEIKKILKKYDYSFEDLGPDNGENSVDYPIYAQSLSQRVLAENAFGVLICGSGTGMQIAANKVKGIRAAFSYDAYSAEMARKDNDANILTLRAREFDHSKYDEIIRTFLETKFSGLERHQKRIDELKDLENSNSS